MAAINLHLTGIVGAQPMTREADHMLVVIGNDRVYLNGDCGQVRGFAEAILMACPPPRVVVERSENGTEIVLNGEMR